MSKFMDAYKGSLAADALAMPASLCLAWKYHDDFAAGITANAMVGGDNCHRGAVVGSLLGAAAGSEGSAGFSPMPLRIQMPS